MKTMLLLLVIPFHFLFLPAQHTKAEQWRKFEMSFTSSREYENPVQDLKGCDITFTSPSGRSVTVNLFWDGGLIWKARFMPAETGTWKFRTNCSDVKNEGLHGREGSFNCQYRPDSRSIYRHGSIIRQAGQYHLAHSDGTPFFYLGCTAWNGALKSTAEEWEKYLADRAGLGYSVIQLVTTQWRGCDKSSKGLLAFEGSGRIRINPRFFDLIDEKIDRVNEHGLVAVPVILWALQNGSGRDLSPGYYLPDDQAILLAKYIVARYGGNHVIWALGGDGIYTGSYEQRWKTIGRAVFDGKTQGIVAQHPCGRSWIGDIYRDEQWLDIVGYQSSHSNEAPTVTWITGGPMSRQWAQLPPRPLINMEPNYEQIREQISDKDVRNACYWSLFATPVAGITYGANGIWPWLRPGERILNHSDAPWTSTWEASLSLPGSLHVSYLAGFFNKFEWWNLFPAQDILAVQPGDSIFNQFISILKTPDNRTILAYVPVKSKVIIRKPVDVKYAVSWFNPVRNSWSKGTADDNGIFVSAESPEDSDMLLVLTAG
ncbi:MAG: DUF4038 domain-containing protein [Bacteroidales bacterium]|nr:DUF4038 domain-containing protein [Bacteroidales bacterium]